MTSVDLFADSGRSLTRQTVKPDFARLVLLGLFFFCSPQVLAGDKPPHGTWPPASVAAEALKELPERRADLRSISQRMFAAMYMVVEREEPDSIVAERIGTKIGEVETPPDARDWYQLLESAQVTLVMQYGDGTTSFVDRKKTITFGNTTFRYAFLEFGRLRVTRCSPAHSERVQGRCIHKVDSEWGIEFSWWPDTSSLETE